MIHATMAPEADEGTKAFFEKRQPEWGDA